MIRLHPEIANALGIAEIPEKMILDCVERVKMRVSRVETRIYRRRPLQKMLADVAKEAIVGCYNDYFPRFPKLISNSWPWAHVTIKGNRATIEIWVGQDYEDGDGIEPFDVTIVRGDQFDVRKFMDSLFTRKAEPKSEPELLLARVEPPPPPPPAPKVLEPTAEPPPASKSRGRRILDE